MSKALNKILCTNRVMASNTEGYKTAHGLLLRTPALLEFRRCKSAGLAFLCPKKREKCTKIYGSLWLYSSLVTGNLNSLTVDRMRELGAGKLLCIVIIYYFMYLLHPISEFVQIGNGTRRRPIPIGNFWIGMGSPSIQKQNVSQTGICFWKSIIVVHNSSLGHPIPELLSVIFTQRQ